MYIIPLSMTTAVPMFVLVVAAAVLAFALGYKIRAKREKNATCSKCGHVIRDEHGRFVKSKLENL